MNQIEKDIIIHLLCTSDKANIKLAEQFCKEREIDIESILTEYGYNLFTINTPYYFEYSLGWTGYDLESLNVKKYPKCIEVLSIYNSKINKDFTFPNDMCNIEFRNCTIEKDFVFHNIINTLRFVNCKFELTKLECRVFNIEFENCDMQELPEIEQRDYVSSIKIKCEKFVKEVFNFSEYKNLNKLSINNSDIEKVTDSFKLPTSLEILDLSYNNISKFNISLNNITSLDLEYNNLTKLNLDYKKSKLKTLNVRRNPLLKDIKEAYKVNKQLILQQDTPQKYVGKVFDDFMKS